MKEISLKRKIRKSSPEEASLMSKEVYPSFSIYEDAPDELLKLALGSEVTARVKLTSKDIHEGKNGRKSVGFDVISVEIKDSPKKKEVNQNSQTWME